jgi:hypothetical protein
LQLEVSPRQVVYKTLSQKTLYKKGRVEGLKQYEHLPSKCEALSSNFSATKNKQNKTKQKESTLIQAACVQ